MLAVAAGKYGPEDTTHQLSVCACMRSSACDVDTCNRERYTVVLSGPQPHSCNALCFCCNGKYVRDVQKQSYEQQIC